MIDLTTSEQQAAFLTTCAEFIPYIQADCMGLSPGVDHFRVNVDGLTQLKVLHPDRATLLQSAIAFYEVLVRKAPGPRFSMYPRGSAMFDNLDELQALVDGLCDWAEELEDAS